MKLQGTPEEIEQAKTWWAEQKKKEVVTLFKNI